MTWALPEMFETDGGVVRWARLGNGPDPIVLVHGTPYSSLLWRDIAPALALKRTVFVFDLLGYGQSDQSADQDLTLAAQARRFVDLLAHWEMRRPSVVANDIGGAIVLRALLLDGATYRDLTIFDAVSGGGWERGLFKLMRTHPEVVDQLPDYAHESLVVSHLNNATHLGFPPHVLKAHLAPWLGPTGQTAFYRQYRQLSQSDTEPYEAQLGQVAVPVKLLWGREDRILPPEYGTWLHERIPHAELHRVADAGHLLQEDAPAQLLSHLLAGFTAEHSSWPQPAPQPNHDIDLLSGEEPYKACPNCSGRDGGDLGLADPSAAGRLAGVVRSDPDAERFVAEPAKDTGAGRSPYERDRARVLHSAGFRRLATKTQVHTAGSDDFLRTRLTHSLEVAQIAREMGRELGCDPDVVDTAGLAHDLGHPPFGHNGEDALDAVAQPCGGFEGNAQTLRVLTRLEAKVPGAGLNLTRAGLDAACKYPWFRRAGERKFGAYADDAEVFGWLREPAPAGPGPAGAPARRCLEAQVMDWADDVAYSVHDVEDGFHGGYLVLGQLLADPDERAALCADVARAYWPGSPVELAAPLAELLADPVVAELSTYDGSHAAQVALKRFTSVLTGRFAAAAVAATRAGSGGGRLRRYAADLVVPREVRAQCALLKGVALRYVMRRRGIEPWYTRQREILTELVGVLADRAPDGLDPVFAPIWKAAPDDPARLRVVIDQVASLTDPTAIAWHRDLTSR